MTMPWRHRLRLLRRGVGYTLAVLLVLLALGNGIGSQLLPLAERHPRSHRGMVERARWTTGGI